MARFFQEIDANGDGIVDRKELEDFVTSYGFEKTTFIKAFEAMDAADGAESTCPLCFVFRCLISALFFVIGILLGLPALSRL